MGIWEAFDKTGGADRFGGTDTTNTVQNTNNSAGSVLLSGEEGVLVVSNDTQKDDLNSNDKIVEASEDSNDRRSSKTGSIILLVVGIALVFWALARTSKRKER